MVFQGQCRQQSLTQDSPSKFAQNSKRTELKEVSTARNPNRPTESTRQNSINLSPLAANSRPKSEDLAPRGVTRRSCARSGGYGPWTMRRVKRRALSILGISPPLRGDGVPAISLIGTLRKNRNELVLLFCCVHCTRTCTVMMPRGVAVARGTS
jgi:hypothetical protein